MHGTMTKPRHKAPSAAKRARSANYLSAYLRNPRRAEEDIRRANG